MLIKNTYNPTKCECCGMTTTYLIALDKGACDTVKAISTAIRKKGINLVHPRKEMEVGKKQIDYATMVNEGLLTSNQVGNLSKARFHGLIAKVKGKAGYYCLTNKGAKFLKGDAIPRLAIISKATGHQEGYWGADEELVTIEDFKHEGEYWAGITFNIINDRIIYDFSKPDTKQLSLNF